MKKAIFIIPIFKRIELATMCIHRLKNQSKTLNFDICIIGSEEDLENFDDVIKINKDGHVSDKLNLAIKTHSPNYEKTVIWGSDNFANDKVIERLLKSKSDVVGFDKIYFHSTHNRKSYIWNGQNMTIGVGRSYKREVLEKYDYKIYPNGVSRGLDTASNNLYKNDFKETVLKLGKDWILDVKHEQNITSHIILKSCQEVGAVWDIDFSHLVPKDDKNVNQPKQEKQEAPKVKFTYNGKDGIKGSYIMKLSNAKHLKKVGYGDFEY